MAEKKNDNRKQRRALEAALNALGLEADDWSRLIRNAVVNDWTETEFFNRLAHTRQFRRNFPGFMVDGAINPVLESGGDFTTALRNYGQLRFAYQETAEDYGVKVNRGLLGELLRQAVSPDEFTTRLQVNEAINANPGLLESVQQQFKLFGEKVDDFGLRKILAGVGTRDIYDIYEAARLMQAGIGLSPEAARNVARGVGQPGALANLEQLITQVRAYRADIGPELARQGITDEDLATLAGGSDPKGLAPTLQGILENRRALGQFVAGTYAQRGPGGGIATLPTEGATSAF